MERGWLPSREERAQHPNKVQRDITMSCIQRKGASQSGQGLSSGLVTVTIISIFLLIGLVCAIGIFAAKTSGYDLSFMENWVYGIRAHAEGYSAISRSATGNYRDVEMRRASVT